MKHDSNTMAYTVMTVYLSANITHENFEVHPHLTQKHKMKIFDVTATYVKSSSQNECTLQRIRRASPIDARISPMEYRTSRGNSIKTGPGTPDMAI